MKAYGLALGLALLLAGSPRRHELAHAFAPHSATVSWAVVLLVWRAGIRRYTGAGG